MNDKVDIRQALRVFDNIITEGKKIEEGYELKGLCAFSGFDGYTITIKNDYVQLAIFFHNKFSFTFSNRKEKILFLEKLAQLDKAKS